VEVCAFSMSSSGARCVLEKSIFGDDNVQYECQVSLDHSPLIDILIGHDIYVNKQLL